MKDLPVVWWGQVYENTCQLSVRWELVYCRFTGCLLGTGLWKYLPVVFLMGTWILKLSIWRDWYMEALPVVWWGLVCECLPVVSYGNLYTEVFISCLSNGDWYTEYLPVVFRGLVNESIHLSSDLMETDIRRCSVVVCLMGTCMVRCSSVICLWWTGLQKRLSVVW